MAKSFDELAKSTASGVGSRKAFVSLMLALFAVLMPFGPWASVADAKGPPGRCLVLPVILPDQAQQHIPFCVN